MPDTEGDWESVEGGDRLAQSRNLSRAKQSEIQKTYPNDVQHCKTKVLGLWMQNAAEISWERLAQAVEPMDDYKTVAHEENFPRLHYLLCL